jgi:tetratricopeptide (TPR) repeat protein
MTQKYLISRGLNMAAAPYNPSETPAQDPCPPLRPGRGLGRGGAAPWLAVTTPAATRDVSPAAMVHRGIVWGAMTEAEYIQRIAAAWPRSRQEAARLLPILTQALTEHPRSARLLVMRGDLAPLVDDQGSGLADALAYYEQAITIDPTLAEAHQAIGYFCDVMTEDFERAERAFRTAIELGAGVDSYVGLARVLAQRGRPMEEILKVLTGSPHAESEEVKALRAEIAAGVWSPI